MGKPDFRLGSAMVAVVAVDRLLRRGGASTAEAAVATGIAFASAIVIGIQQAAARHRLPALAGGAGLLQRLDEFLAVAVARIRLLGKRLAQYVLNGGC